MQTATPMLRQYQEIKSRYQDCILFFRLGDFYEMFFDDAKEASGILELVLTSRGQEATGKIPMCGVPYHAADNYIARLIKAGKKVAICEQVEDVSVAKGLVKRDVIRVISAGTYFDDAPQSRYLLAIVPGTDSKYGFAFTDTTGGVISANQTDASAIVGFLAKMPVAECLYPEGHEEQIKHLFNHPLLKTKNTQLTPFSDWAFNADMARKKLLGHFNTSSLGGFGIDELPLAQSASGALLEYLKSMHKQDLKHINGLNRYHNDDYVYLSPAAHYGLDMPALLNTLDKTITPMGRRLFRFWLYHPLKNAGDILKRQKAVQLLSSHMAITDGLNQANTLNNFPDIEKSLSRLSSGCGQAKDLLNIRQALVRAPIVSELLKPLSNDLLTVSDVPSLRSLLERAINPDMPLGAPEGQIIRPGYNTALDQLRELQENGRRWLAEFQAKEIKRTKINSLKVGFNNVFGYYIEITKSNLAQAPSDYIRKQTLANAERYITPELKEYEEKILTARDEVLRIEKTLIAEIEQAIFNDSALLHRFCQQIATLDSCLSLSQLAGLPKYVFPEIDDTTTLDIRDGRHPVVEKHISDDFIPNDICLDTRDNRLIILTGPNMAGKSTYIRQCAVLVIMAQMGAPVPASQARVGIVDKIFTRIGAHDDITKGQSTFMVEMTETADMLNNLSERSLIILDEIGRGTSTYDGLSLAWALAEYLQTKKARTLFATHFHELTALAEQREGIKNFNVAVKEWKDTIIFLHKIVPGGTDDSYGIYVAKLAGIPSSIINRSKEILSELELGTTSPHITQEKQLSLFSPTQDPAACEVRALLEAIDVNVLTPVEALNKLNELKKLIT